jgi:flotillin
METQKSARHIFMEQQARNEAALDDAVSAVELPEAVPPEAAASQQAVGGFGANLRAAPQRAKKRGSNVMFDESKSSEELQMEKEPLKVRVTGRFFQRVIVPPNAYVIHTRLNREKPVTLGLGLSFKYNPKTDAYLVIPAAMQTIGVVANCISKEKQGINVLAYVQWQIEDFSIAYKKLDISDGRDPLAVVNAQLREQAEAAIKDKIATMSVEEVLTDKEPVIEELTNRLKQVAEAQTKDGKMIKEGLGIKIITVQIREALVSSAALWEDLQSPFRFEQQKKASISYLEMQNEIKNKELESLKAKETREAETNLEVERIKQKKKTEVIELSLKEDAIRFAGEQAAAQNKLVLEEKTALHKREREDRMLAKEREIRASRIESERELLEKEAALAEVKEKLAHSLEALRVKARLERENAEKENALLLEKKRNELTLLYDEAWAKIEKLRNEARNVVGANAVLEQLVAKLPEIAKSMPQIKEMKVIQSNTNDPAFESLISFVQKILGVAESLGIAIKEKAVEPQEAAKGE